MEIMMMANKDICEHIIFIDPEKDFPKEELPDIVEFEERWGDR